MNNDTNTCKYYEAHVDELVATSAMDSLVISPSVQKLGKLEASLLSSRASRTWEATSCLVTTAWMGCSPLPL